MAANKPNKINPVLNTQPLSDVVEEIFLGISLGRRLKLGAQTTSVEIVNVKDLGDGLLPRKSALDTAEIPTGSQTDRFRLQTGDVLITARGWTMKVAGVQDEQSGAIAGPNLIVVRPGRTLLPPLVLALLRSPSTVTKLASETAGTTVPSLNVSTVSRLRVSVPPQETQTKLAELVRLGNEHYAAARRAAEVRRQIAQEVAVRALTK